MINRLPPQDIEAEISVLGSCLLDNQVIQSIDGIIAPEDFYFESHKKIFSLIISKYKTSAIDMITLSSALKEKGQLDSVGGSLYVSSLVDNVPSAANIVHYAGIVKEMALRREVLVKAYDMIELAYSKEENVNQIIEKSQKEVLKLNPVSSGDTIKNAHEVLKSTFQVIEDRSKKGAGMFGISTGLRELDEATSGLHKKEMTIIAGRPSQGKSALAFNIVQGCAMRGEPAMIFSIEMPNEMLMIRSLASLSKIESRQIRKGFIRENEWPKLTAAAGDLSGAPIYFDESPILTPFDLRIRCRRAKKDYGIKLAVVDYLQIMTPTASGKYISREQQIAELSSTIKSTAKELDLAFIAVSQLNRTVDTRPDKRPIMSDLRESGAIEQDADLILFIYRDEVYHKDREDNKGIAEIIIGKQRHGPLTTIKAAFLDKYQLFTDLREERPDLDYLNY